MFVYFSRWASRSTNLLALADSSFRTVSVPRSAVTSRRPVITGTTATLAADHWSLYALVCIYIVAVASRLRDRCAVLLAARCVHLRSRRFSSFLDTSRHVTHAMARFCKSSLAISTDFLSLCGQSMGKIPNSSISTQKSIDSIWPTTMNISVIDPLSRTRTWLQRNETTQALIMARACWRRGGRFVSSTYRCLPIPSSCLAVPLVDLSVKLRCRGMAWPGAFWPRQPK